MRNCVCNEHNFSFSLSCYLIVKHWFLFFYRCRHPYGGKRHYMNQLQIGSFEAYRHILSWCRHSGFCVLFFPFMFLFFSVTLSFRLAFK